MNKDSFPHARTCLRAFTSSLLCLLAFIAGPLAAAAEEGVGTIEGNVTNSATNLPLGRMALR